MRCERRQPAAIGSRASIPSTASTEGRPVGDDIAVAPDRAARTVVAAGRIVVGLLWMSNAGWKVPPAFGENGNRDLHRFTAAAVDQPVFPPFSFVIEHVVLPNFRFFGWIVLLVEIALGAFLTFGIATRLWAVVGGVHATVIALCVLRLAGGVAVVVLPDDRGQPAPVRDGGRSLRRDRRCRAAGAGHQPGPGGPPVVEGLVMGRYRVPVLVLSAVAVLAGLAGMVTARSSDRGEIVGLSELELNLYTVNIAGGVALAAHRRAGRHERAVQHAAAPLDRLWAEHGALALLGLLTWRDTTDNLFGLDGRTVSLLVGLGIGLRRRGLGRDARRAA